MIDNELRQQYKQAVNELKAGFRETFLYKLCEEIVRKLSKILSKQ